MQFENGVASRIAEYYVLMYKCLKCYKCSSGHGYLSNCEIELDLELVVMKAIICSTEENKLVFGHTHIPICPSWCYWPLWIDNNGKAIIVHNMYL